MNSIQESDVLNAVKTKLPPCCLRIFRNKIILVGTYDLDKSTGYRSGSLDVFTMDLKLLCSNNTYGAILDLKLSPFDDTLICTAHSTGNIMLWRIGCTDKDDFQSNELDIHAIANLQLFEKDVLIASCHFSPLDCKKLLVTNTAGEAATIDIRTLSVQFTASAIAQAYSKLDKIDYEVQGATEKVIHVESEQFLKPHELECWTAEFGSLQPFQDVVFTGGDDSRIMAHDLRSKEFIWSNNRIHDAGVVSIKCSQPNFRNNKPTSIITGSYDDNIRSLDLRMMGESIFPGANVPTVNKLACDLGGGVWRFVESPIDQEQSHHNGSDRLLVCCMYNGAKVVTMNDNSDEYFQIQHYLKKGHDSMCYGGDWSNSLIATCSFYDNSLQTWIV
ncbi:ANL_collapsed_G0004280.mRNA.1.CDS.1 [Saccharomyces cerevisiae]|nr:Rrt2p [Saccharomyces cerevisiae YJM1463]ONH79549.1 Diphthine methyltransferase [Saccharomyces cerevisiae]CAI4953126.1 ANL_HP_G0020760.mRNA.1.CDS.1 [Saccharomyces cerevisiae]CAI5028867.1 ANL_HP_G0078490.mRNA.1.CDS.1 [Saccharomyces cerevisiae]CAI5071075.1 AVN_HP_G0086760.mRNA.1.CDS.1 [Saccharomyces cerevisiae]